MMNRRISTLMEESQVRIFEVTLTLHTCNMVWNTAVQQHRKQIHEVRVNSRKTFVLHMLTKQNKACMLTKEDKGDPSV